MENWNSLARYQDHDMHFKRMGLERHGQGDSLGDYGQIGKQLTLHATYKIRSPNIL